MTNIVFNIFYWACWVLLLTFQHAKEAVVEFRDGWDAHCALFLLLIMICGLKLLFAIG